jgi:hypothetical protein
MDMGKTWEHACLASMSGLRLCLSACPSVSIQWFVSLYQKCPKDQPELDDLADESQRTFLITGLP